MLDEELMRKVREGDIRSIEDICIRTWEPLYRFIYFKVQNRQEAEDITQETYVKALSFLRKSHERIENVVGFLKTVSLNILRDNWRSRKRRGAQVNIDEVAPDASGTEDSADSFVQRELLREAMEKLKEDQRMVIELRIIKGYSVKETAKIMNRKEGAVRVLQYRAVQSLAEVLKELH